MFKHWLIMLFIPFLIKGQNYPAKPANYVTDETQTLTQEQQNVLNQRLKHFEDSTSNQIFVYMASSLNGQDMESLCQEIFHEWHIGQKNKNNGVLIAIFINDHKFRIHTGYGLEGNLPDLLTKRIQDEKMRPEFKKGDYFSGIYYGIKELIYYTNHAFVPESEAKEKKSYNALFTSSAFLILIPFYLFNVVVLIMVFYHLLGRRGKKFGKKKTKMALMFIALFFIPMVGAIISLAYGFRKDLLPPPGNHSYGGTTYSSGSSSWSSSDSSWSSSDSSSDFGGGGGGDSGGGGSSSDW